MIDKVGLINEGNEGQIPFAFELYADPRTGDAPTGSSDAHAQKTMAQFFKDTFSRNVPIHFVGCWDTVSSIGLFRGRSLPGTIDGMNKVCHFRHGLALDERRVKFLPEYAHGRTTLRPDDGPVKSSSQAETGASVDELDPSHQPPRTKDRDTGAPRGKTEISQSSQSSDIKEVWFAGTHSDIGGGNVENAAMNRTRPSLRWMAFEAAAAGLHLRTIDRDLTPDERIEVHESLIGHWWVLEYLPIKRLSYGSEGMGTTAWENIDVYQSLTRCWWILNIVWLWCEPSANSTPTGIFNLGGSLTWAWWILNIVAIWWLFNTLKKKGMAEAMFNPHESEALDWYLWIVDILAIWMDTFTAHGVTSRPHYGSSRLIQEGQKIHSSLLPILPIRNSVDQLDTGEQGDYVPKACWPGKPSWWLTLQNLKSNEKDAELVEYDPYDRARDLVEDYNSSGASAQRKEAILSEIYDFASSAQGRLAVRQANALDRILHTAENLSSRALDLVMNIMEKMTDQGSSTTFGSRATRRRQLSKLLSSDRIEDQKVAQRFLDEFTKECLVLSGHDSVVTSVAFSPDGKNIVSGSWDQTIRIWDAHTGKMVRKPLQGHTDSVWSVAFSPDGTRIVSGSGDETIRIWDAQTGKMVGEPLQGHTASVRSVAFSPDGTRIVSGSDDETIRIWDSRTGEPVGKPLQGHTHWVWSVAFSPDGTRIVSGSDNKTIRIWDARTGESVGEPLRGHTNPVYSVAFSPDGTRIVLGSGDETIRIWDARTGEPVGEPLQGHTHWVLSVAFSPDGTRIVSGSRDETIRIWDARTGEPVGQPLQGHTNGVLSVAFSPDGKVIVSGSDDGTVRLWDVESYVDAATQ